MKSIGLNATTPESLINEQNGKIPEPALPVLSREMMSTPRPAPISNVLPVFADAGPSRAGSFFYPQVLIYVMKDIKIFINNPDDKLLEQINEVVSSPAFEGQKIRVMPDCLIEDAEILTNLGFKKIIELDKNDLVANYDPDTKLFSIKIYINYEFENPEISIPNLDSEIYKLHFRGFGFCDKTDSYCRVNDEPVYLKWGVAWYRNFRVWDADITSLQTIQACEYGYSQFINAQKYYFSLTVDTIEKNTIKDKLNADNKMTLNYWVFHQGNDFREAFDNAMRENYSTDNFDKTYINENNYISGINEDGTDYLISSCASECKRCYSSSNTDCYECKLGYSIYGKQCKVRTGYFLKTPPDNSDITKIPISIKDDDTNFNLEKETNFTMTLYIKFFGIELKKVVSGKKYYHN